MIHSEVLAAKQISSCLNIVLRILVNVINYLNMKALKATLFSALCKDMDVERFALLFYCKACGKVIQKLCQKKIFKLEIGKNRRGWKLGMADVRRLKLEKCFNRIDNLC